MKPTDLNQIYIIIDFYICSLWYEFEVNQLSSTIF